MLKFGLIAGYIPLGTLPSFLKQQRKMTHESGSFYDKETKYTKKLVYFKIFQNYSKAGPFPTMTNTKITI